MSKTTLNILGAVALYFTLLFMLVYFENGAAGSSIQNIYDAIWYSIVTLSTVGYGDYYPVTLFGKVLGLVFIFSSLGVLGYLISQLTVKLTKYMDRKKNGFYGTKMEKHNVIIGYNKFSKHIIEQIVTSGVKVAIVTDSLDDIDSIKSSFPNDDSVFCLYTNFENF